MSAIHRTKDVVVGKKKKMSRENYSFLPDKSARSSATNDDRRETCAFCSLRLRFSLCNERRNITTDAFFYRYVRRRRRRGRVYARLDAVRTDARLVASIHTIVCAVSIERDYTATNDMCIFCLDVGERRLGVFFFFHSILSMPT